MLLTGAGRAFSSGADLREDRQRTPDGHPDVYRVLTGHYHPVIMCLREMPKPVVAAVNGAAAGIGLINQVWPDADLADRAEALCGKLAEGPTGSYAGTKRQLNRWLYQDMAGQLEFEARIQQERAASADFAEGVAAFAEKRSPRFTGS